MLRRSKTTVLTITRQSAINPNPRSLRSVRRLKTSLTSVVTAAVVCLLLLSSTDNQRVLAQVSGGCRRGVVT